MRRAVNSFIFLLLIMAAGAYAAPTTAPAPTTSPSLQESEAGYAHGAGDSYWITSSDKVEGSWRTFVFKRTIAGKWEPLSDALYGKVTSLADYQGDLVIVFTDGSWRTVYNGGSTAGAEPPDNAKVIGLAGDGEVLHAIIRNSEGYQLAELAQGKWTIVSKLPDVAQQGNDALLALGVVDHETIVAARTPNEHVAVFSSRQQSWDSLGTIAPHEKIEELIVLPMGRQTGIWVSPGLANGGSVYMDPPNWQKRIDLGPDPGEAAVASERLRLMFNGKEKGKPVMMEKQWDFAGNHLPTQAIDLPEPDYFTPYISWGMWAILALVMLLIFMRRPKDDTQQNE